MSTWRLLLAPGTFKLSKLGHDVFTAAGNGLIFDGNAPGPARFIKGQIAGATSGGNTDNRTAMFGKTFSVKPFVMVQLTGGSGSSAPGLIYPQKGFGDSTTPFANFAFSWTRFRTEVLTDRVNFQFYSFSSSFSYTIDYLVFDYRLGF